MQIRIAAVVLIALAGCDGSMVRFKAPAATKVKVDNPDYVILRPVVANGTDSAVLHDQRVSFNAADRILDLRHLDPASARVEEPQYSGSGHFIAITTTAEGGKLLRTWTSQHIDQQLAVFVGGRMISAPVIKSKINDTIILDGDFTKSEAEAVVARMQRGG